MLYGEAFPDFLSTLPGVQNAPYVPDVARLEWFTTFALNAKDMAPIPIQSMAQIPAEELPGTRLIMHPSLGLIPSSWPILSIWQDCQSGSQRDTANPVDMQSPESLMIVRPNHEVNTWLLSPGELIFMQQLFNAETLEMAANSAVSLDPEFDLSSQLGDLFQRGAVVGLRANNDTP